MLVSVAQDDPLLRSAHADERARAEELAAARSDAYAAGYAEGYAAARAELEDSRARALEQAAARLAEAAEVARLSREALVAEVTADAVELTYALARTILGDETVAAALPEREAVARALRLAPEGEDLVVRIPVSCELTASDLIGLCDTARISIRPDPGVEDGGCIVEAGPCRIDAQISTALERVRKTLSGLKGARAGRDGEARHEGVGA
jgi:flagellar assembly protein FliH